MFDAQAQELIVPAQVEIGVMQVELITHGAGAPYQYVRYQPYGEVRGRFDGVGNLITNPSAAYRYEFTGYESEILSGLLYAGARFYDPTLGLFLTQDPARQFASPYSYGGGDPLNWTDPTGAFFGIDDLIIALVGVAIGFSAAAIQAGVNGASFGEAMRAGAIGGAMAGALAVAGLGVVSLAGSVAGAMGGATAGEWAAWTTALLLTAAGGYSTAEAFQRGQYVVGSVGAVFTAFGLYGLAQGPKAFAQGGNGAVEDSLVARRAPSGKEGPVDGFELSIMDHAANPTRGELVVDLAEGRGLAQIRLDIDRFGTSVLQDAQARFDAVGGRVRFSAAWLPNQDGLADPKVFGWAYRNLPELGLDIGPPAFASYREFALTYIHELGHASLNLLDKGPGLTAYEFEKSQWLHITEQKLRVR